MKKNTEKQDHSLDLWYFFSEIPQRTSEFCTRYHSTGRIFSATSAHVIGCPLLIKFLSEFK